MKRTDALPTNPAKPPRIAPPAPPSGRHRWHCLALGALALVLLLTRPALAVEPDTYTYTYDSLQRLTTVERNDGLVITYTYDAVGNRLSMEVTGVGTIPEAPVIGTATAGVSRATVSFSPPPSNGDSLITGYTVTANPGPMTASGPASPLTVTGLTFGTSYTFTVTATNNNGTGPASAPSNSITPLGYNQDEDGDGVINGLDPFPTDPTEWADSDDDTIGDNMDNCLLADNPSQADNDHDGLGNDCDGSPDTATYDVAVTDAPHTPYHGVRCADCHTHALWWQYSPATASTTPSYAAITTAICAQCHAHAPHASTTPGAWSTQCVDCHDPHQQAQLDWRATPDAAAALYLVQGAITGNFTVNGGQTTFAYSLQSALPGWSDPATWGQKNSTLPPSGLILVVDTTNATSTYEVIKATAAPTPTITIRGGITPSTANKSFGLIYGEMIKPLIPTPNGETREVKFFNPKASTGGYIDNNTPVTGICQVCHARTTMSWNSSGGVNKTGHATGLDCTGCHATLQGFEP